jgi:NADH-quinone oxidoreductase subunit J
MTFQTALFWLFAAILVFAALRVISVRNPVHAALWLVLSFFTAAAIWLMLGAEFLAIVLVLVYVGAVMVLFLFVIMMLEVNFDELRRHFKSYLPVGGAVGALVLLEMVLVILSGANAAGSPGAPLPAGSNTQALGRLLYVDYVYPFELAAVLLLVAIVAAIALTHRKRRETKSQVPGEQVKVRREDRVRLIGMRSEKRDV